MATHREVRAKLESISDDSLWTIAQMLVDKDDTIDSLEDRVAELEAALNKALAA